MLFQGKTEEQIKAEKAWYHTEKVWLVHKDGFSMGENKPMLLNLSIKVSVKSTQLSAPPALLCLFLGSTFPILKAQQSPKDKEAEKNCFGFWEAPD